LTDGRPSEPTKPPEAPTYLPAPPPPPSDLTPAGGAPIGAPPDAGPAGSGVFSLEGRPGAGLYLLAWLFCGAAVALIAIGLLAPSGAMLLFGVVAAVVGLPVAAGYQILARSNRPAAAYRGPSPLVLLVLIILIVNVLGAVISLISGQGLDTDRPEVFFVGLLIQTATYVGVIWVFVVRSGALSWRDLLTASGRVPVNYALAIGAGVGVMFVVAVVAIMLGSLVGLLLDAVPPQVIPPPATPAAAVIGGVSAIVLAPLGEELFFRGVTLNAWWRDLDERKALIWSSVFFALFHIFNVLSVPGGVFVAIRSAVVLLVVLLPVSFVLGALYVRRGLVASLAGHVTYNAIMFGLYLLVTLVPPPAG
jgi:membrane protease YdiL (CAAX protease family)